MPISELKKPFEHLRPGDVVPDGQCPSCEGFLYEDGRFATTEEIARARAIYQSNELEIDNGARVSIADEHVWVEAWVYLPRRLFGSPLEPSSLGFI